jgi:hypothetical protein
MIPNTEVLPRRYFQDRCVTNNQVTRATARYATIDDLLKERPDSAPWRPTAR